MYLEAPYELPHPKTLYEKIADIRLYEIARCESGRRQFKDDGTVVRGPTNDIGILQIHEPTWGTIAKQLGYDIYTLDGNIKMAHYVRDVQGYSAWVCNSMV